MANDEMRVAVWVLEGVWRAMSMESHAREMLVRARADVVRSWMLMVARAKDVARIHGRQS